MTDKEGRCLCWPTPEKYHFVYYGATEPGSAMEYNPWCPAHGDKPRWQVACCNWGKPDAVKFVAYLKHDGKAMYSRYAYTFAEAWAYIEAFGPLVDQYLERKAALITKENEVE